MWGLMTAGWRSLSCRSSCRSLGLSSKYVCQIKEVSYSGPSTWESNWLKSTNLEFLWIEQLLFDLLQSGLLHRLLCDRSHGILGKLYHTRDFRWTKPQYSFSAIRGHKHTRHLYLNPSISSILKPYGFKTHSVSENRDFIIQIYFI